MNNNTNKEELEFNTYCSFNENSYNIEETIGLMFKDYIGGIIDREKFQKL